MERPAQLVYEGSRSFRKYEITIEIVVINLYKFGVFEVLLRDQDSQCALPPIYLRSEIIEHRIKPADIDVLMIDSRHLFDPTELLNDDDLYDLVVRVQIFNFIADRLSIKKRAPDSTEMYEVEYLPALFDPEFGPGKKYRLDRLICDDPYLFGAPAPLEENLSPTKQGTADTILSTSVRMDLDRHSTASAERGANISSKTPGLGVSSRVSSALRTLTTLFGSAKSRSIRPISEEREREKEKGVASAATQSNSNRSKLSRSGSQDRSDMAVQRRLDAQDSFKRSNSNKNFNTNTHLDPDPTSTAAPAATTASGKQQPYHESASGRQGQALAHRMLSRLGDLPDIPDALLGTVIYLPGSLADADAERETDSGRNRAGGAAGAGVGGVGSGGGVYHMGHMRHLHHLQHAAALEAAAHAGSSSSKKTVSQHQHQHRLAEYFQPLPLFRSIEDLCDPRVIERIPHRQHPCLQPPKCVSRLSVSVFSDANSTEPESTKTEAYNHPTNFTNYTTYTSYNAYNPYDANNSFSANRNSNSNNKKSNGAFATYYSAQEEFLQVQDISSVCPNTSPNIGSPCLSGDEKEQNQRQLCMDRNKTPTATNNNSNSRELEVHVSLNQQTKPSTHASTSTSSSTNPKTNSANAKNNTRTNLHRSSDEAQVRRSALPFVSMLRSALLGHSRVGVAASSNE